SGLAPWLLTQDVMVRSAQTMLANASIVKKVMFPIEVLVAKTVMASVCGQAILLFAGIAYAIIVRGAVPASFALLPILIVLHLALLLGLALILSSLTPYVRDIPEFLRVFMTVNIYLMPVTYLPEWLPSELQFVLRINPFSH